MSEIPIKPEISLASSEDGLGIVLVISNDSLIPMSVFEPHPHTSVRLYDAYGQLFPSHYGVFAVMPRWQVSIWPNEVCRRIVILPRFFLAARGTFEAICTIRYRTGNDTPPEFTVRGAVELALPSVEEFY